MGVVLVNSLPTYYIAVSPVEDESHRARTPTLFPHLIQGLVHISICRMHGSIVVKVPRSNFSVTH